MYRSGPTTSRDWVLQELEPKTFHKFNLMLEISQRKTFMMKFFESTEIFEIKIFGEKTSETLYRRYESFLRE